MNSGFPINQLQYAGPTIQDDLFSIITLLEQTYILTGDSSNVNVIWVHADD